MKQSCARIARQAIRQRFEQPVRLPAQDLAVLAGARLRLVGVDHQVVRPRPLLLGHEGPLQAGVEAGAAAAAQAGGLDLVADPLRRLRQHVGRAVPDAALPRRFQPEVLQAVEVGEDAVLVFQDARHQPLPSPASLSAGIERSWVLAQRLRRSTPTTSITQPMAINTVEPTRSGMVRTGEAARSVRRAPIDCKTVMRPPSPNN